MYLLCCKLKAFYTSSRRKRAPCKCSSEINICLDTTKTREKPNESALNIILVKHWITSTKLNLLDKNYFSKLFFQKWAFKSLLINKRRIGLRQWQMNLRLLYQCIKRRHVTLLTRFEGAHGGLYICFKSSVLQKNNIYNID